jgi:hypothetical protein
MTEVVLATEVMEIEFGTTEHTTVLGPGSTPA